MFIFWIQNEALNTVLSFKYWLDVAHANLSKKRVLGILCTKCQLQIPAQKALLSQKPQRLTHSHQKPSCNIHWAVGCILTSDSMLSANKQTPRPQPHLQTQLPTMKPRTDMTKLLMQKEKLVPQFLLSHVVILISSIFQVIIVLE